MRVVGTCVLVSVALAVLEPEAVYEWEGGDEVAESDKRVRWLSCLFITHSALFLGNLDLKSTLLTSKHPRSKTLARIKADILLNCVNRITLLRAEEVLSETTVDLSARDIRDFLTEATAGFDSPDKDVSLTPTHRDLYKAILAVRNMQEIKKTDDGFEVGPMFENDLDTFFGTSTEQTNGRQVPFTTIVCSASVALLGAVYFCKRPSSVEE